ncbi:hypothetical protein LFZ4_23100 [Salmonella enterica subsp. enterica serovar Antsalova str. S01-0511]|nr:hypothetical protein LFZ4_23100 [Salmonella enterica subsp. enterica serovar Antsalova str. S01-0511]AUM42232.1 hypothetical protein SEEP1673_021185 [Salmonella enterica subsp. enterica serovar Poona str. ATCC BAA-1673]
MVVWGGSRKIPYRPPHRTENAGIMNVCTNNTGIKNTVSATWINKEGDLGCFVRLFRSDLRSASFAAKSQAPPDFRGATGISGAPLPASGSQTP